MWDVGTGGKLQQQRFKRFCFKWSKFKREKNSKKMPTICYKKMTKFYRGKNCNNNKYKKKTYFEVKPFCWLKFTSTAGKE